MFVAHHTSEGSMSKQPIFDQGGNPIGHVPNVPGWGDPVTNDDGDQIGRIYPDQDSNSQAYDHFGDPIGDFSSSSFGNDLGFGCIAAAITIAGFIATIVVKLAIVWLPPAIAIGILISYRYLLSSNRSLTKQGREFRMGIAFLIVLTIEVLYFVALLLYLERGYIHLLKGL